MKKQRGIAVGWLYLIGVIILIGMLTKIGYSIYGAGKEAVRVEWAAANEKQRAAEAKKGESASTNLEASNAKAKIVYRTITKEVDKYIDRPIYRNVCFDGVGLRDANAALRGALATPGKPDKRVP